MNKCRCKKQNDTLCGLPVYFGTKCEYYTSKLKRIEKYINKLR